MVDTLSDIAPTKTGKVAVVGGTGLIGRHVLGALVEAGIEQVTATYHVRPPVNIPRIEWRSANLLNPTSARSALAGVSVAIICAGRVSTTSELRRDPVTSVAETLRIGLNVLEAAAFERLEQVILISSCTGYPEGSSIKEEASMFAGDPPSAWFGVGWAYRFLEKQLEWYSQSLGLIKSGIALRPTLVYGPHDDFSHESGHFIPSLIRRVVERERPIEVWGDGQQSRNLIYAADVACAVVAALRQRENNAAYNIAASASTSVNQVLATLLRLDGFVDADLLYRRDLQGGAPELSVSPSSFEKRYSWKASTTLEEGLAQTIAWYRKAISA